MNNNSSNNDRGNPNSTPNAAGSPRANSPAGSQRMNAPPNQQQPASSSPLQGVNGKPPSSPMVGISRSPLPMSNSSPRAGSIHSPRSSIMAPSDNNVDASDLERGSHHPGSDDGSDSGDDGGDPKKPSGSVFSGHEEEDAASRAMFKYPENCPNLMGLLMSIFGLTVLMLLPAALVYISGSFPTYSLSRVKAADLGINSEMEFLRYSILAWLAVIWFLILEYLVVVVPVAIVKFLDRNNACPDVSVRHQLSFFYNARSWIIVMLWIMVFAVIGSRMIYHGSASSVLKSGLAGMLSEASEDPSQFKKPTVQQSVAESKIHTSGFYIEGVITFAVVFFALYAVVKFIVHHVTVKFQKLAFKPRIIASNFAFRVVRDLLRAIRDPESIDIPIVLEGKTLRANKELGVLRDRHDILKEDEESLNALVDELFAGLAPAGTESADAILKEEHLRPYFNEEQTVEAFKVFDVRCMGQVSKDDMKQSLRELISERFNISKGLVMNSWIIGKFESILRNIAICISCILGMPLLGMSLKVILFVLGLIWTSLSYLFKDTSKQYFESLFFVFTEHVYDYGDVVVIDGEYLTVERIDLLSTIFRRWDGSAVYMTHTMLAAKNIVNVRRSDSQMETVDLVVSKDTSLDKIWSLRDKLDEFCKGLPADFTGPVSILSLKTDGSGDDAKSVVKMSVKHVGNFQDLSKRAMRHNKFMAMVKQLVAELQIEYFP